LPVLGYRTDLKRQPAFLSDRAAALGIPVTLWNRLQAGESVAWDGGSAGPEDVLGPDRRGLSIAYATDTRPSSRLAAMAEGVDLLVCEGTYGSDDDLPKAMRNQHMTFREAATLARDAGAQSLWITHFSPALEDPGAFAAIAASVFPNTTIGRDGLTTSLKFSDGSSD
jgi:ribonuclease Z